MTTRKYNTKEDTTWKTNNQEKLSEIAETIQNITKHYENNPEDISDLLSFTSKFYKYSYRNNLLILRQNPYSTFVQKYDDWKEMGYNVKGGEKGIKILVPVKSIMLQLNDNIKMPLYNATDEQKKQYKNGIIKGYPYISRYTVGNVFDISQTSCPVEDYPKYYHMGYKSDDCRTIADGLKEYAEKKLLTDVRDRDFHSISLKGRFFTYQQADGRYLLEMNDKLKDSQYLSVLSHEVGHRIFHKDNSTIPTKQKELEADCFSVMLQEHLGVEISDQRKRHLVHHYHELEKSNQQLIDAGAAAQVITLEQIINNVFKIYQREIAEIEKFIDIALERKQFELTTPNPEYIVTEKLSCMVNISENKPYDFDTIAYYTAPLSAETEAPALYSTFEEAYDFYKERANQNIPIKLGYFDQRDGQLHDLVCHDKFSFFIKNTDSLLSGKDIFNTIDCNIIRSIYNLEEHINTDQQRYRNLIAEKELDYAPTITILMSEHPEFEQGKFFKLNTADSLFFALNNATITENTKNEDTPYYKVKFEINFRKDGKASSYTGRYDIGNENGSLLQHMENFINQELEPDSMLRYEQLLGTHEAANHHDKCQYYKNELLPYFKLHINLYDMEAAASKRLETLKQHDNPDYKKAAQYYNDIISYVHKSRAVLNDNNQGEPITFPEFPQDIFSSGNKELSLKSAEERLMNQRVKQQDRGHNHSSGLER